jgi:RHS repeat-associated protein
MTSPIAGNLQQLRHVAAEGSYTRALGLVAQSNRLATLALGTTTYEYAYDANGNLTDETTSRHFQWDYNDRMHVYRTQIDGVEPSVYVHYLYAAGGERLKKLVRKQGGQYEVTVYIDGVFEYQRTVQGSTIFENNTVHVMDNQNRIALVRAGAPFPDDSTPAIKYILGDNLGSSTVVVDDSGGWINREEYLPYGETSFGSFAMKRYRFTGKERDRENSLYYHGLRYYAPWLAKWIGCDPAGTVDGTNLYAYGRCNPTRFSDPSGTQVRPANADLDAALAAEGSMERAIRVSASSLTLTPEQQKDLELRWAKGPGMSADNADPRDAANRQAMTEDYKKFCEEHGPSDPQMYKLYRSAEDHANHDPVRFLSQLGTDRNMPGSESAPRGEGLIVRGAPTYVPTSKSAGETPAAARAASKSAPEGPPPMLPSFQPAQAPPPSHFEVDPIPVVPTSGLPGENEFIGGAHYRHD